MTRKLIDYLPPISQEYEEIQQICETEQKSKEKIWAKTDEMYADYHLTTQSIYMATLWEKTLGIRPQSTDSLDMRNARIKSKLQETLPYTYRTLVRLLNNVIGDESDYKLNVDFDICTLTIKIRDATSTLLEELPTMLDDIVPAHMVILTAYMMNTHKVLAQYPHYILSEFTHKELQQVNIVEYISKTVENISEHTVDFVEKVSVENIENIGFRDRKVVNRWLRRTT